MSQPLHRSVFNCDAPPSFSKIARRACRYRWLLWLTGVNGDTRRSELHDLYLHYGSKTISRMNFHRHRDLLRRYCTQGDGPAIAD